MKHSTSFKTKVLAIVLTIAALAAGQTARATTKTYTVSGGQGNTQAEFYALFSDGSTSTGQIGWTYNSTAEISFSLPGGLTLKLSNTAKQLVYSNGAIGGRGSTTLTVSSTTYYIYRVRLLTASGDVIQLDANGNAVNQGGVSQCDYWNMTKSFSHTFSNGILFSKIEVSYATAIPFTDAVISDINDEYVVSDAAVAPTPTVTWHGTTLTLGTHYTLSYQNNTAAGTATIKVTGMTPFGSTQKTKTYTLVWATYTVHFNKNNDDATGTMSNQNFTYNTAQNLTANAFSRTGYTFAAWNRAANGSGTSYSDQQEVQNLTATNGGTVDLYAQWTPITYTLRLHHNDGTGAYTDMAMTYDQPKNIQSISRTGYTFAGWNTAADGSGTAYTDGQSVQNLTATDGATVDLYAQWEVIPWSGTGSSETPYIISYPSQLDLLATRVNSGNNYQNNYFVLGADITYNHTTDWDNAASTENNYTPIGGFFNSSGNGFLGTFDGQGHTVSGIRIYKGGSDYHADSYLGLFGCIYNGGVVKNVTVSDMRITGYSYVGGIVGQNDEGGSVENCHATGTVCLNAVQGGALIFGGIVGSNYRSDISNCTSAVTITVADNLTDCQNFGGIVGTIDGDERNQSRVSNCHAVGVAIPDVSFKDYYQNDVTASGAIAGYFDVNSVLSNNYYSGCTLGGTPTASGIGVGYDDNNYARHDVTDNNGAVPATLHTLTLGENITAAGLLFNQGGTIRVPAGSTVTLSYSGLGADQIAVFRLNDNELSGNSFTMPAADATVSASAFTAWGTDKGADGSKTHPYVITRTQELNLLAERVNSGSNEYPNTYFKLGADITYPHTTDWDDATSTENNYTAIGNLSKAFCGIFDGDGHTVSGIRINKPQNSYQGLFGRVYDATVKNVTLNDARITGYSYVGGIVGQMSGYSTIPTIENCLVLNTAITANYGHGAVVGYRNNGTLNNNHYCNCTVNGTANATNVGTSSGDQTGARSVHVLTLGAGVSATGVSVVIDGTTYYASNTTITLAYSGEVPMGYQVFYSVNGTAISGNSFTMPAADATVSTTLTDVWGIAGGADGSLEHPYTITTTAGLDLLAQRVNSGNSYYDKYFVLANDITYTHTTDWDNAASTENNYTPIGGNFNSNGYGIGCPFQGTFDGQGHTVSGIRIYKDGTSDAASNLGLFGISFGVVKNVTVSDMRITGYSNVGGIVGENSYGGNVENCHATATVCLNAVQNEAGVFGGIVGHIYYSVISSCTSAVTITVADNLTGCQDFGGIVGTIDGDESNQSRVSNCLAVGVSIPDISFKDYYQNDVAASGAIAGYYNEKSFISNNYYSGCTLGGTPTASGIGVGYDYNNYARHDVTDNNGAVPAVVLQGRTLYKDGDWNTLCLPFSLTAEQIAGSPLAGAEARTLSSASYADGTLTLNFSDPVQTLTAGTPYIIRWEKASDYVNDDEHNIVNPVFTNVTIDNTARNVETTNVSFVGTYNAMSFTEENRSILLVGAGNSLFYPLSGASLGAFRAYFQLNGITAGDVSGNVKMFFGEEENETSLSEELRVKSEESDNAVYDLSGRKINSQLPKGIYIKNGKKVLINK